MSARSCARTSMNRHHTANPRRRRLPESTLTLRARPQSAAAADTRRSPQRGHVRAALGANRNRILVGIFLRVLAQLGAGAVLGLIAAVGLEQILEGDMMRNYRAMLLPLVVLLMMTIGVIAAIGPVRQGLRIQPIEALRDE
jgi:hypothetical protein